MEASDGGGREERVESSRAYVRERVIECLKERSSLATWKVSVFVGGRRGRKVVSSAWHEQAVLRRWAR